MAVSDGSELYTPEQDVLTYGSGCSTGVDLGDNHRFDGSTKTMRKMMGGDQLVFIAKGEATNTFAYHGVVQFFCKA